MIDTLREYLREYVDAGIWLFPLAQDASPMCKIFDDQHERIAANHIKNYDELIAHAMAKPGVTMFGFRPDFANLIVIDLDNSPEHANKVNGIQSFLKMIAGADLEPKTRAMLSDFPNNHPCHVMTPHNGIHLYFKADFVPTSWTHNKKDFDALNIEIKRNTQVTAAGSIRNGATYYMNGRIEDAPQMTFDIMKMLGKPIAPPPKPMPQRIRQDNEPHAKWSDTADGVIDKAVELYGAFPANEFVSKTATLFAKATDKDGFSLYTADDAIAAIESTSIHQARKDKAHTRACVKWIFEHIGR